MSPELKFLNDIIKPWDGLNALLVERYAFQPDISSVTAQVSAISTAIKHQVDILAIKQNRNAKKLQHEVDTESVAARLMSDVSDSAKHVKLRNPNRENYVFVAALFEVNDTGEFCFLRNGVFVEHATLGCQDFMQASLDAIAYWARKRGISLEWNGSICEANAEFFPIAFLHFNSAYCIKMESTRIKCFRRNSAGTLEPFAPEEVRFEIY